MIQAHVDFNSGAAGDGCCQAPAQIVHGDAAQFASCIDGARARCTHPAMVAWLPRLDALEARGIERFGA